MSDMFSCHDKDSLIAYLYDEVEVRLRQQIEEHLRSCRACASEVESLSAVRAELSAWTPPETELGITIARKAEAARPVRWWSDVPVWAQVAAATLVLAVGLGVANIQVRSGPDGVVVTTGWMTPAESSSASGTATDESWKPAFAALESQLRSEIHASRAPEPVLPVLAARPSDGDATLKQVQTLLAASEQRQRQELALRLTQLTRDLNVQRQADLLRISQSFGQVEGRTGEMMARQRQMMNYVMRVSGQPQQ